MPAHSTDLLNTLGNKRTPNSPIRHGQPVLEPTSTATAIADLDVSKENDMIAAAASAAAINDPSTNASSQVTNTNASGGSTSVAPVEPVATTNTSSGWTEESLIAEMKKAREEAKRSRLEKNDAIDRLKAEYERKLEEIKLATKPLEDTAKELAELKAKEADAKKTLAEKLADREAQLIEKNNEISKLKETHHREVFNLRAELEKYQTEVNVQNQFYQEKLNEELNLIPDKFKDIATRLIKGCDSIREQVEVLREAKDRGLFKEKQTVVSHAVPTLADNARISSASSKTEDRERTRKMKSTDKIGEALKTIDNNPIFRGRKN